MIQRSTTMNGIALSRYRVNGSLGLCALLLCSCFAQNPSISEERAGHNEAPSTTPESASFPDETDLPDADPGPDSDLAELDASDGKNQYGRWRERSFAGHSQYTVSNDGENEMIQAETDGQASVLYRQTSIDLTKTPIVSWRWKISNIYRDINEKEQSGDDYPARLYVVIQTGLLPWETLAINYVWSSTSRQGESWDNAFTDKARMLALQSGPELVGQWQRQQRNVIEDFKTYFDMDVEQLDGYAIMIDGDNSNQSGLSWFSNIEFLEQIDQ